MKKEAVSYAQPVPESKYIWYQLKTGAIIKAKEGDITNNYPKITITVAEINTEPHMGWVSGNHVLIYGDDIVLSWETTDIGN